MKAVNRVLALSVLVFVFVVGFGGIHKLKAAEGVSESNQSSSVSSDFFFENIQPILDKRCVACHACTESPCQLNLTSPFGLQRGATTELLDARLKTLTRHKLFHDANSIQEWRQRGFYSVIERGFLFDQPQKSVLEVALERGAQQVDELPELSTWEMGEPQYCGGAPAPRGILKHIPGMPYRMAPLNQSELDIFQLWYDKGSPFPDAMVIKKREMSQFPDAVKKWEDFFNGSTSKHQWTARYLFEHLFWARFSVEEAPGEFFELVRSRTPAPQEIDLIPTVYAFKAPEEETYYYRLRKVHSTIVYKNHIVYRVNDNSLQNLQNEFINADWGSYRGIDHNTLKFSHADTNPFSAFKHIPTEIRYRWTLRNANLMLQVAMRAQNCRNVAATSPIWDNFLILFLKPEVDATIAQKDFYYKNAHLLPMPNMTHGKNNAWSLVRGFAKPQAKLTAKKREVYDRIRPNGLNLSDIWDGEGEDQDALITAFRHEQNASSHWGQWGEMPRAVLLFDYTALERVYYLCAITNSIIDIFYKKASNVQYLFDFKNEMEELFMSFVPEQFREAILDSLVEGEGKKYDIDSGLALPYNSNLPFEYAEGEDFDYEKFLGEFLKKVYAPKIIGSHSRVAKVEGTTDLLTERLSKIADIKNGSAAQMPNVSYLRVERENEEPVYFTMVNRRFYKSRNKVSLDGKWEKQTRDPNRDFIEILRGIHVDFPEKIYMISESEIESFISDYSFITVNGRENFLAFDQKYGLNRYDVNFWRYIDEMQSTFKTTYPIRGGVIDLHLYGKRNSEQAL